MGGEQSMGKYLRGDHVKIEVTDELSGNSEWMWLLVDHSDDEQRLVFGELDSEPIAVAGTRKGQSLAVSYERVRDHKRFE